jgi:hypothetical protein
MTRFYPSAASAIWAGLALGVLLLYGFEHEGWALLLAALVSVLTVCAFVFVRSPSFVLSPDLPGHSPFSAGLSASPTVLCALATTCWAASAAAFYGFEHKWWRLALVAVVWMVSMCAFVCLKPRAVARTPASRDQARIRIHAGVVVTLCVALAGFSIVLSAMGSTWWAVFGSGLASALIVSAFLFSGHQPQIRISRITLLLVGSVVILQWPLRISFLAAVPRLEEIADAIRAGTRIQTPVQAGVFTIKKVDTRPAANPSVVGEQIVCLWLTPESGQPSVLAQCRPSGLMFNVQSHTILSSRWQFVTED